MPRTLCHALLENRLAQSHTHTHFQQCVREVPRYTDPLLYLLSSIKQRLNWRVCHFAFIWCRARMANHLFVSIESKPYHSLQFLLVVVLFAAILLCQLSFFHTTKKSTSEPCSEIGFTSISSLCSLSLYCSKPISSHFAYILFVPFVQGAVLTHNATARVIRSNQSLVLQRVTKHSAGNYSCSAINGEGETVSNQLELRVKCKFSQYIQICMYIYRFA